MSTAAAVGAPWIGLVCGLVAWFVCTWKRSGEITVETSGNTINAVAGNITSWGVGWLMSIILTFAFPAKYSSTDPRHIERSNKIQGIAVTPSVNGSPTGEQVIDKDAEKTGAEPTTAPEPESFVPTGNEIVDFLEAKNMEPMDPVAVKKGERLAIGANVIFLLVAILLVPFTLFGTQYIYSRSFFHGWCVVSFIWVWVSAGICIVYPVIESTGALKDVSVGLWRDFGAVFGGRESKAEVMEQSSV